MGLITTLELVFPLLQHCDTWWLFHELPRKLSGFQLRTPFNQLWATSGILARCFGQLRFPGRVLCPSRCPDVTSETLGSRISIEGS